MHHLNTYRLAFYILALVTSHFRSTVQELARYKHLITSLPRWQPIDIGWEQDVEILPGMFRKLRTLSVKPPIFEVRNFLTADECDYLVNKAVNDGLQDSRTSLEGSKGTVSNFDIEIMKSECFSDWDLDKDKNIDMNEVSAMMQDCQDVFLSASRWKAIFSKLEIDKNGDGIISKGEFRSRDNFALVHYIRQVKKENPETKGRNSQQIYIDDMNNDIVQEIETKIIRTTGLPEELVQTSESMQIVKYEPKGHYNCHVDSSVDDDDRSCCHTVRVESEAESDYDISDQDCKPCRYMTFLYFLNQVESGGETAFPLADNETFSQEKWDLLKPELCNLAQNCKKSNLVIKPEKGKAIIWYNHQLNITTQWLGDLDLMTFHGGCDVISGFKWIANNWINVSDNQTEDILNWSLLERDRPFHGEL